MKKDLSKLVDASDDELFKGLGISADDAKVFDQGARHLFGEPDTSVKEDAPKAIDIRAHKPRKVDSGDIRPKP